MRHISLVLFAATLALGSRATAATTPPGINIRWDQCFDDSGTVSKSFACDTNSGSDRLVLSFVLDQPMSDVSGTEITVDFVPSAATTPAWWDFRNAGSCRPISLQASFLPPPGSSHCIDWAAGNSAGGIGAYTDISFLPMVPSAAKRAKLVAAVPISALATLDADQEYAACVLTIDHRKTVGTGSCDGCAVPMCIVFQNINVTTAVLANNRYIHQGANTTASQIVRWQDGIPQGIVPSCGTNSGCNLYFSCVPASTPTHTSTWGAVKALYR